MTLQSSAKLVKEMSPKECASPALDARVLVVGHTFIPRINQRKLDVLSRWCKRLAVLVPSNWINRNGLFDGQAQPPYRGYRSFTTYEASVIRPGHLASYLFRPAGLRKTLRDFDPGLVHVEQEVYSLTAALVSLSAKAEGRKVVVFGWENLDRKLHPAQSVSKRVVLALADAIVCGSSQGAALVRRWGYRRRIAVIPQLGVDPAVFRQPRARESRPLTIGYVGRLVQEKGVDLLIRGVSLLAAGGRDVRACICGDGPCSAELRRLAERLGVAASIQWTGAMPHERVPELMRGMDILVLPSRGTARWREQFGHVLIEAMAMGIPVVGSSSGAIPEVIGRHELIFEEDDAAALARVLDRLVTDSDWRREVADYGSSRLTQNYTHEKIAGRLVSLWADVLGEKGTGGGSWA